MVNKIHAKIFFRHSFLPIHVIVDESEADGFVSTEQRVESESENHIRRRFVHLRQLISAEIRMIQY